ncbi:unnamed protein product [Durusdinium trenchii]|uniref:Prokaryotic-type class I peptide chain release factors domain-containing protein n=1 Tax=Durusdinium trenchii TaxID=1381693 RepID=A0ABP0Q2E4_9DINO
MEESKAALRDAVAAMDLEHSAAEAEKQLEQLGIVLKDLEESFTKSSGPGGQNVNKVETAVRLRHGPSGLEVKAQSHRTQLENRVSARRRLAELSGADQRAKRIRSNKARRARRRKKKEEAGNHDLERGEADLEALAVDALTELGFKDTEPVGSGKILDPAAPLVLRCVDRWVSEIASHFSEADAATELPMPIHMPSDRYLDGLDEETRAAVIKRYIPEEPFGGTGVISNATDCFELMKKWEEAESARMTICLVCRV